MLPGAPRAPEQLIAAAQATANGTELPQRYWKFLKWWVALGIVAFFSLAVVFYLMVAKPA